MSSNTPGAEVSEQYKSVPERWFDSFEKKKGIMPSLDFRLVKLAKLLSNEIYLASNHGIMPSPPAVAFPISAVSSLHPFILRASFAVLIIIP